MDNDGKVGIGTSAPTHTLHIASPAPTVALQDIDSTTQQVGYINYRDAGNVEREGMRRTLTRSTADARRCVVR